MSVDEPRPKRFIGLDLHRYYLVATGVDEEADKVYGPKRVNLVDLEEWIEKNITPEDSLVVEATANAFQVHDALRPHAHSVIVVHPPDLALIVRSQVKTDKKAAYHLARLHAKGLLSGIWVPPQEVRDLRTLTAQRRKMIALKTQAKNRLQGVLHRYSFPLPKDRSSIRTGVPGGWSCLSPRWSWCVSSRIGIPWSLPRNRSLASKITCIHGLLKMSVCPS